MSKPSYRHDLPKPAEALALNAKNLAAWKAIPIEDRKPRVSTYDGTNVNPNVHLWKYRGRLFVVDPHMKHGFDERYCCWGMPQLPWAEFCAQQVALLKDQIGFVWLAERQRRVHPMWNDKVLATEALAPRYADDPDASHWFMHK